jgi:hypothetical protein
MCRSNRSKSANFQSATASLKLLNTNKKRQITKHAYVCN